MQSKLALERKDRWRGLVLDNQHKKGNIQERRRQKYNVYRIKKKKMLGFLCSRISRSCPFIIKLTLTVTYMLSLSVF
jgi:hypothetical protein